MPEISLVIPAFNEEDRLIATVKNASSYLDNHYPDYEIIVVDDGSSDSTYEIASDIGGKVQVIKLEKNSGKGAAVRKGMIAAKGVFRFFSDADLSTPIYEIEKLFEKLKSGYDLAIGSRAVDTSLVKEHQPFYREFMGKTFNKIVRILVVGGIKDTQCGFKGFRADAASMIFASAKIDGFGFDVELLFLAKKFKLSIAEIPVEWYNDERSKVDPVRDSIKMLAEILRIRSIHRNKL